jgi:Holliday junction resolvase
MNSREKGARGEREWAEYLRRHGFEASRGQQFSGGVDSPDVKSNLHWVHWEVKRVENLNIWSAYDQAKKDSGVKFSGQELPFGNSKTPVVAYRRNRSEWMVTLAADDFMKILKKLEDFHCVPTGPDIDCFQMAVTVTGQETTETK